MTSGRDARERAERLEREGRVEDAARAYLDAGSLSDAVRVFARAELYRDAANLVMRALRTEPSEVGRLVAEKRRLAHRAALYFGAARLYDEAIAILDGLGDDAEAAKMRRRRSGQDDSPVPLPPFEPGLSLSGTRSSRPPRRQATTGEGRLASSRPPRARASRPSASPAGRKSSKTQLRRDAKGALDPIHAQELASRLEARGELELAKTAFARLGAHRDVARLAEETGAFVEAAKAWARAGRRDEAARCQLAAGNEEAALDELLQYDVAGPRYRELAGRAIRLARKLSRLDLELESFVGELVQRGVTGPEDLEVFYNLARLYESQRYDLRARRLYERIERHQPMYRDVAHRLEVLQSRARVAGLASERLEGHSSDLGRRESHHQLPSSSSSSLQSGLAPRSATPASSLPPTSIPPRPDGDAARTERFSSAPPRGKAASFEGPGLPPGTTIGGRYRIKRLVGQGMSDVYEVLDLELDAIIALKLFSSGADHHELIARCRRELMLARELTHENIVRVYDIGQHDDRRFITMELLDGADLREVMDATPPRWSESIRYLIQACDGLHAAHMHGVVHRDVKPENFFVVQNAQLKVMDFGIAKKATDNDEVATFGRTSGTPTYMSPEQIRDYGSVTPASDVYALGVVAYELFTGTVPFESENIRELMFMHVKHPPSPPSLVEPDLPSALDELILEALAKSPADRIKSCRAMAQRLEALLETMS